MGTIDARGLGKAYKQYPNRWSRLAEWITRGAGERDSRELLTALDNLGVSHGESAQTIHTSVSATTLGRVTAARPSLIGQIRPVDPAGARSS